LQSNKEYILIAIVTRAHGLNGEVKLKTYTDDPAELEDFRCLYYYEEKELKQYRINKVRFQGQIPLVKFKGINDRNQAESIRGTELYIKRDDFKETAEGEYYYVDLIGLKVFCADQSEASGTVKHVYTAGAGHNLEILPDNGDKEFHVPFNKEAVLEVDIESGAIRISADFWVD